jgi:hypothetical protein
VKYADLSKYVRMLWGEARYGWDLDPTYRKWAVDRVNERLIVTGPQAMDEYRAHLAFDYRLDQTETGRFNFWWAHITEKGFNAGNPLSHLHKGKVPA